MKGLPHLVGRPQYWVLGGWRLPLRRERWILVGGVNSVGIVGHMFLLVRACILAAFGEKLGRHNLVRTYFPLRKGRWRVQFGGCCFFRNGCVELVVCGCAAGYNWGCKVSQEAGEMIAVRVVFVDGYDAGEPLYAY